MPEAEGAASRFEMTSVQKRRLIVQKSSTNRLSAFLLKNNPHYRPIWGITRLIFDSFLFIFAKLSSAIDWLSAR